MIRWILFFALLFPFEAAAQGDLMDNPTALEHVEKGLFYIYNTESEQAEEYIKQTEKLMPQHPVGPMMKALNINWSENPIEADTEDFRKLIGHLQISLDRTKTYLKNDSENMEAIFFAMAIHSWLAQFYDEDGQTFKALSAAKKAYQYMKIGFEMLDQSPEFYFSTGLYNYYRVQYPESNPIYKPFLWFFRDGNKELGLSQLDHASEKAIFTRAEASMYLAHIYLRYEEEPAKAVKYSRDLVERFPDNTFFKINYTEALLAAAKYTTAYPITQKLLQEEKPFYRMSGEVFTAIHYEKHLANLTMAKTWYQKSLESGEDLGARADNKKSLAYAGLARIAAARQQVDEARSYYRTAMKLAQYDGVKNEARRYLRNN